MFPSLVALATPADARNGRSGTHHYQLNYCEYYCSATFIADAATYADQETHLACRP
ncbi:hypothetical protein C8E89_14011 [Mycolicibacterium moriokaense]|uniref:Uncharacterized protein n=1 Tax=Mycolicibacterium moriokaense TaxID=39691 RepID=A0A318H9I1_9MYCO|nr:hypothetical protein C8E89_14011 [Mycolicibacterium moriokaense]